MYKALLCFVIKCLCLLIQVEFFGPLCDLVEGSLEVEVGGAEGSDKIDVPCLAELCVRRIHSAKLGLFSW